MKSNGSELFNENAETKSIEDLPVDVLGEISKYLGLKALARLMQTNKNIDRKLKAKIDQIADVNVKDSMPDLYRAAYYVISGDKGRKNYLRKSMELFSRNPWNKYIQTLSESKDYTYKGLFKDVKNNIPQEKISDVDLYKTLIKLEFPSYQFKQNLNENEKSIEELNYETAVAKAGEIQKEFNNVLLEYITNEDSDSLNSPYGQELIKLASDYNCSSRAQSKDGLTALMVAIKRNDKRIVKHLLEFNNDIDVVDNKGSSALTVAAKEGHQEIVEILIEAGVDVNASYMYPAIHECIKKNNLEIVRVLIEAGVRIPEIYDNSYEMQKIKEIITKLKPKDYEGCDIQRIKHFLKRKKYERVIEYINFSDISALESFLFWFNAGIKIDEFKGHDSQKIFKIIAAIKLKHSCWFLSNSKNRKIKEMKQINDLIRFLFDSKREIAAYEAERDVEKIIKLAQSLDIDALNAVIIIVAHEKSLMPQEDNDPTKKEISEDDKKLYSEVCILHEKLNDILTGKNSQKIIDIEEEKRNGKLEEPNQELLQQQSTQFTPYKGIGAAVRETTKAVENKLTKQFDSIFKKKS